MKKSLIIAVLLGTMLTPSLSHAQQFTEEQQVTLDSLKQQLINILLQQIAVLQKQLETLIAQQAQTTQTVADVSNRVDTVVKNTTPVVSGGEAPSAPTVSVGTPYCHTPGDYRVDFPITVTGTDWKYGRIVGGENGTGLIGMGFKRSSGPTYIVGIGEDNLGTVPLTVTLGNTLVSSNDNTPIPEQTLTSEITINDVCKL